MSIKVPFSIDDLHKIDPKKDLRWVPDGKNVWFLPYILDLKNDTYCGYWYGTKKYSEKLHVHTGISQGIIFRGEFLLKCNNKKFSFKKNEVFLLPPHIPHTADLIPGKQGFLYFGSVVGKAKYAKEILDAKSYYQNVDKHYKKHKLGLTRIFLNR